MTTVQELQKQLAAAQAQVQQLTTQLGGAGAGATQTENPYSVASRLSQGAKAAADAAEAGMKPMPMPQPGSNPVPMPGTDPSTPALTPEEEQTKANNVRLALLGSQMALFEAQRPRGRVVTSSRMPTDPWDRKAERMFGMSQEMKNFYTMSEADQRKVQARAAGAGMDVAGFLGLSPLDQYKAINGENVQRRNLPAGPGDAGTRITLPARPGDGGTVIPLSNRPAVTGNTPTNSIPNAQFTSFDSGVRTVISPNAPAFGAPFSGPGSFVRGSSAPINAARKSGEIARDLTYRSNLAGAALDSLRRPTMRFGF